MHERQSSMKMISNQKYITEFFHTENFFSIHIHCDLTNNYGDQTVNLSTVTLSRMRFSSGDRNISGKWGQRYLPLLPIHIQWRLKKDSRDQTADVSTVMMSRMRFSSGDSNEKVGRLRQCRNLTSSPCLF